jgi:hypothetical protein
MTEAHPRGLVRRVIAQDLELIATRLADLPDSEHKTKAAFYLAGAQAALDLYFDSLGVIPSSR